MLVGPRADLRHPRPGRQEAGLLGLCHQLHRAWMCKIYAVQPSDWPAFKTLPARLPAHRCERCRSPGRKVFDKTLPVEAAGRYAHRGGHRPEPATWTASSASSSSSSSRPRACCSNDQDRYWQTVQRLGAGDPDRAGCLHRSQRDGGLGHRPERRRAAGGREHHRPSPAAARPPPARMASPASPSPTAPRYLVANQGATRPCCRAPPYYWGDDAWYQPPGDRMSCAGMCSMTARCTARVRKCTSKAGCAASAASRTAMWAWSAARSARVTLPDHRSAGQ